MPAVDCTTRWSVTQPADVPDADCLCRMRFLVERVLLLLAVPLTAPVVLAPDAGPDAEFDAEAAEPPPIATKPKTPAMKSLVQ